MMTIGQYYLDKLAEECAEVAQQVSKNMIFGKDMSWAKNNPDGLNNAQKLRVEVNDLLGTLDVLMDIGELPEISPWELLEAKNAKRQKMAKYLDRAQRLGRVENINHPVGLKIHDTYSIEPEPDGTGTSDGYGGPDYGPSLT